MDNQLIQNGIIECMKNIGIFVDEAGNFEIQEYINDSITFLTFIVELEQKFGIEIPDNYLTMNELNTLADVSELISVLR
jgi:acyl carrier protein